MSTPDKLYIAGIGMITSVGANTAMTAASVKAGISGYGVSRYYNGEQEPIVLSCVPDVFFKTDTTLIDEGAHYSEQIDRVFKMAGVALREAVASYTGEYSIPLVLAMPEAREHDFYLSPERWMQYLSSQKDIPIDSKSIRFISTGRSAGLYGLDTAFDYLYQQNASHVLLGGSDSYRHAARLLALDETERLLASNRMDGFVAGEGAGFVLLTRNINTAIVTNGHVVTISAVATAEETGHLYSKQPYQGNGLATAFSDALRHHSVDSINSIYTSMNGENHWAKEYGVACLRNKHYLTDTVRTQHPADCFGDLGVATGSVLLGLAATDLLKQTAAQIQLVYSSSDSGWRAATTVEKIKYNGQRRN